MISLQNLDSRWIVQRITRTLGHWSTLPVLAAATALGGALALGGGARQNLMQDVVLQLLAVPLFVYCLAVLLRHGIPRRHGPILALVAFAALVPLLQLVPLPSAIARHLPFGDLIQELRTAAALPASWSAVSIAPEATWKAVLSLLAPVTVFLAVLQLGYAARRSLALLVVLFGVLNALLGLIQVAQGPGSRLRFYDVTNTTEAVGLFANRNHFAAILYVALVLALPFLFSAFERLSAASMRRRSDPAQLLPAIGLLAAVLVLLVAQLSTRSRAGLILTGLALLGSVLTGAVMRNRPAWLDPRRLVGLMLLISIALTSQFALARLADRLDIDPLADARFTFARRTFEAAKGFMPFGSGVGTFVPAYALFERPQDALIDTFANRAHNDLLEGLLESGLFAVLVLAVFAIWFTRRLRDLWRTSEGSETTAHQRLARSAALVVGLLLVHSLLDYPLRTSALLSVFALTCAMMCAPAGVAAPAEDPRSIDDDSQRRRKRQRPTIPDAAEPVAPPRKMEPWGDGTAWPAQWGKPPARENGS